jgi:hypothetical protein
MEEFINYSTLIPFGYYLDESLLRDRFMCSIEVRMSLCLGKLIDSLGLYTTTHKNLNLDLKTNLLQEGLASLLTSCNCKSQQEEEHEPQNG